MKNDKINYYAISYSYKFKCDDPRSYSARIITGEDEDSAILHLKSYLQGNSQILTSILNVTSSCHDHWVRQNREELEQTKLQTKRDHWNNLLKIK